MRFSSLFLVVLLLIGSTANGEPLQRIRIDDAAAPLLATELSEAGYDILPASVTRASFEVIVSRGELDRLQARGLVLTVIDQGRPFREIQASRAVPPGYLDLGEIVAEMNATEAAYPSLCKVVDLTSEYDLPATIEGRHLYAIKVSDNPSQDEDEPAFLLVSCHHCREIVTPVIALYALEQFTTLYGIDQTITDIVDNYEIWIAPVWNPDGYEYVFNWDNYWRKNRHVFPGGIGVDLNRNYPFGWDGPCAGSTDPSSNTYKGPSAGSEAETQTLMEWALDQQFDALIDYHSSGREVLYGYACWSHPFDNYLRNEASALAYASTYGGDYRSPSAEGEHFEWQVATTGAHGFLIETASEFQPSYASALDESERVFPGILWMLEHPIPLWGHVTDSHTGAPLNAEITILNVSYSHGEGHISGGPHGRYHAFMPSGTYDLLFEADGYEPQTITGVAINQNAATQLDVQLSTPFSSVTPEPVVTLLESPFIGASRPEIHYRITQPAHAALRVFDVRGRLVRTLADREHPVGTYQAVWDGTDQWGQRAASGSYFWRLEAGNLRVGKQILLIR